MSDVVDLVIFDCDGVLVDSERLAVAVEAEVLTELGWAMDPREVADRFVGRSAASMQAEIEARLGRAIDWESTFGRRHAAAFESGLEPVAGVADVLDALAASARPYCVASSSARDAIGYKLARTGLADRFDPAHVFSADDVAHGKPAPDVFLLAAATMGAEPSACVVVEDSPIGVRAGLAAGMRVLAFGGGITPPSRLEFPSVEVFGAMADLPALLGLPAPADATRTTPAPPTR